MVMSSSNPDAGMTLPPGVPALGAVLADKYRLDGILGIGGMGVVYRSHHALLGVPVAVKIILPEFAARPEFIARFTNEAKAAARIQSDHIARVSDVGSTADGMSFLVMELLEGEDLGSILAREGPQSVELCVDWVLQAIVGLADAHSAGIIHRDLKPSNLFLTRRVGKPDRIKICDFGISKASFEGGEQVTKTNSMLGSPAYMAPEQLRSSRTVDKRADIWSLGVILYELFDRIDAVHRRQHRRGLRVDPRGRADPAHEHAALDSRGARSGDPSMPEAIARRTVAGRHGSRRGDRAVRSRRRASDPPESLAPSIRRRSERCVEDLELESVDGPSNAE
jgi:serine/threonine protein kinase